MEQKKFNKVILILVIVSIVVSIVGTIAVLNSVSFAGSKNFEDRGSASGSVSLNIAGEPQTYMSSGVISLNIVGDDLENSLEE